MQFQKQIGVMLMVAMLFLKAMVGPLLFLDYEIRKDYIVKNFCVNKDKPKLHCDGKCYLAKRIKAAEKDNENQQTHQTLAKIFSIESFCEVLNFQNPTRIFAFQNLNKVYFYLEKHTLSSNRKVFQPPKA